MIRIYELWNCYDECEGIKELEHEHEMQSL